MNNANKIRTMLSFEDKDDFYFVQVLKRRKDNPDMEKDMVVIDNFYIGSFESYDKIVPQIIKLCDMENARGYFRLNKRNYKALAPHMVKRVVEIAFSNDCRALKNVFDSVAGEHHSDPDKKWLIDVDNDKNVKYNELLDEVIRLQKDAGREPMTESLPTKNGAHLITRPFNLTKFKVMFLLDVHHDNPTILYCP
jgi:hypothetical protein